MSFGCKGALIFVVAALTVLPLGAQALYGSLVGNVAGSLFEHVTDYRMKAKKLLPASRRSEGTPRRNCPRA